MISPREFATLEDAESWDTTVHCSSQDAFIAGVAHGRANPLNMGPETGTDETASRFRPGDVVQLKSGGIPMVVIHIVEPQGSRPEEMATVSWVDATGKPWEQTLPVVVFMADCSKPTAVKNPETTGKATFKTALTRALQKLRVNHAGRIGDTYRWSVTDLATDLAPVLADELGITMTEVC